MRDVRSILDLHEPDFENSVLYSTLNRLDATIVRSETITCSRHRESIMSPIDPRRINIARFRSFSSESLFLSLNCVDCCAAGARRNRLAEVQ